jgi:hypothetical protein
VLDRDRGCRFPGCVATAHLEVHHVVHWADGGRTDLDNLVSLCPFHHDAHHGGEFAISGDPNDPAGLVFTAPGGFPILPGPAYAPVRLTRGRSADREPVRATAWTPPLGPDPAGDPAPDPGWDPAPGPRPDPDGATALELGVGYPGATGEVLRGKWVTFHEPDPVPI